MTWNGALPPDFRWAPLVPELLVSNLRRSLDSWCGHVGFSVAYERPSEGFAYLHLAGSQVMLEQRDADARNWVTGPLEPPLGRGVNFQIEVANMERVLESLRAAAWPLFMDVEKKWYVVADQERGQRQFLVKDPDGYLLRLIVDLGTRKIERGEAISGQGADA